MRFSGVGIMRIVDGKMIERWNHSDILTLLKQLGAELYVEEEV